MGKNEIDLMILGALTSGPTHGYDLKRRIAIAFGALHPRLSDSAVYPRLIQFEKRGLVKSKIEVQYNAPNRKIYQLMPTGIDYLKRIVATPVKTNKKITNADNDDLALHVLFFGLITKEQRRRVVEPYYNYVRGRIEDAEEKQENYKSQMDKFASLTLEYGIPLLKAELEFYKRLIDTE